MQDVYLFIWVGHEAESHEEERDSLSKNSSSPIKVLSDAQLLSISSCRSYYVTDNNADNRQRLGCCNPSRHDAPRSKSIYPDGLICDEERVGDPLSYSRAKQVPIIGRVKEEKSADGVEKCREHHQVLCLKVVHAWCDEHGSDSTC